MQQQYQQNGYVIVRGLLTPAQLHALREQTDDAITRRTAPILFEAETGPAAGAVPAHFKDDAGRVFRRLNRVIDRGGAFERVALGPLADAAARLLPRPLSLCLNRHNMLMLKAPYNPAPVLWHQDAAVWDEDVYDHLCAIVALDDFRPDNGCLEVVPGSHRLGPVGLGWEDNTARVRAECRQTIAHDAVQADLKAGDAVLFHGLLLHGSPGNPTAHARRSFTAAFFPGDLRAVSAATGEQTPQVRLLP